MASDEELVVTGTPPEQDALGFSPMDLCYQEAPALKTAELFSATE